MEFTEWSNGSKLLILPHPLDALLGLHVQEMNQEITPAIVWHVAVESPLGEDLHVIAQVPRPEQMDDRPLLRQPVGQELLWVPYVLKEPPRPVAVAKEHLPTFTLYKPIPKSSWQIIRAQK